MLMDDEQAFLKSQQQHQAEINLNIVIIVVFAQKEYAMLSQETKMPIG
jgi:hypothetical protein